MKDSYLFVSDLHLTDIEDHEDGWRRYKSSAYIPDGDFATLLLDFKRRHEGENLTLILNGDIFDFDLVTALPENPPWKIHKVERKIGLFPSEEKSVWKLNYILKDHKIFLRALADFVRDGGKIVYILGNHDRELYFPRVKKAFTNSIASFLPDDLRNKNLIEYYHSFYYVPGKFYVEHGQQYDYYSTFKNLLCPTINYKGKEMILLPMGNMSNRFLMGKIGYFNPHSSDFILSATGYLMHWLRYYAFSRRSLVFNWIWGSLQTMYFLRKTAQIAKKTKYDCDTPMKKVSEKAGLDINTLHSLMKEESPPIEDRFFRVLREFWMDRLIFFFIFVATTVTLALVPIPLWIKLMVPLTALPLAYFLYEKAMHGVDIFVVENEIPKKAKKVGEMLDVKFVIFGHTHKPRLLTLDNGLTFVDSGSWAPVYDEKYDKMDGLNNFFELSFEKGEYSYRYGSWDIRNVRIIPVESEDDQFLLEKFVEDKKLLEEGRISFLAILGNTAVGAAILEKVAENKLKIDKIILDAKVNLKEIENYLIAELEKTLSLKGYSLIFDG